LFRLSAERKAARQAWLLEKAATWVESDNASLVQLGLRILGIEPEKAGVECPRCAQREQAPELDNSPASVLATWEALVEAGFFEAEPGYHRWLEHRFDERAVAVEREALEECDGPGHEPEPAASADAPA
jgi:hypothetical protein